MTLPGESRWKVLHETEQAVYVFVETDWPGETSESVVRITQPSCRLLLITPSDEILVIRRPEGSGVLNDTYRLPRAELPLSALEYWQLVRPSNTETSGIVERRWTNEEATDRIKRAVDDAVRSVVEEFFLAVESYELLTQPSMFTNTYDCLVSSYNDIQRAPRPLTEDVSLEWADEARLMGLVLSELYSNRYRVVEGDIKLASEWLRKERIRFREGKQAPLDKLRLLN